MDDLSLACHRNPQKVGPPVHVLSALIRRLVSVTSKTEKPYGKVIDPGWK